MIAEIDDTHPFILVVEDELEFREVLCKLIKDRFPTYSLVAVNDGMQALEMIQTNADRISCIVLDLAMPKLTGYELLEIMEERGWLKLMEQVLVISNYANEGSVTKHYEEVNYVFKNKCTLADISTALAKLLG